MLCDHEPSLPRSSQVFKRQLLPPCGKRPAPAARRLAKGGLSSWVPVRRISEAYP